MWLADQAQPPRVLVSGECGKLEVPSFAVVDRALDGSPQVLALAGLDKRQQGVEAGDDFRTTVYACVLIGPQGANQGVRRRVSASNRD